MSDPPVSSIASFSLEVFGDLLDRCQWPLYSFLRGIVGDEEQARDLMQDAFYESLIVACQGEPYGAS